MKVVKAYKEIGLQEVYDRDESLWLVQFVGTACTSAASVSSAGSS